MKSAWLQPFTWAAIAETNRQLCVPKAAPHKRASGGWRAAGDGLASLRSNSKDTRDKP
jgi:hypothetical protein